MVLVDFKLYDSTTPTAPKLLCTVAGAQFLRFAGKSEISYRTNTDKGKLVRLDLDTGTATTLDLAAAPKELANYSWSPDGKELVYWVFTGSAAGSNYQAFLKPTTGPVVKLTEDTPVPGRGCCAYNDNIAVSWSASGAYVAIVNTFFNAPHLQIFRADGGGAFPALGEEVRGGVMAHWGPTGDLIYFADNSKLRSWAPPDTLTDVTAGSFFDVAVCQGGCALAYTVRDASSGAPKTHVSSVAAGDSDVNLRSAGAFVTANHLWYYAEELNPAGGLAPPYRKTGKVYDYNIQTKLETELPVSVTASDTVQAPTIADVWPR